MISAETTQPDNRCTQVRWVILALLFMASFMAYVLRSNMSIAGERMMADLGLSKIQLGMVFSAFAWGYAIFQFPGGIGALLVPVTAEVFGWVPALATGSVFAIIGVGLWLFVRADKPMIMSSGKA